MVYAILKNGAPISYTFRKPTKLRPELSFVSVSQQPSRTHDWDAVAQDVVLIIRDVVADPAVALLAKQNWADFERDQALRLILAQVRGL